MSHMHRPTLSDLQAILPAFAAEARQRSGEFERNRKLSADFVDKLKRAGAFKVLVPADATGLGGSLNDLLELAMALGEADASTAWVMAHANVCSATVYGSADPRFRDEFFSDPNACGAWSNLPRVKAVETEEGLRITGSWGFESGCTSATFVGGMVLLPPLGEGKSMRMVSALAPVSEARIEETWDPVGLAGTGSHDVHFDDVLVPWHRTFAWPNGAARVPLPMAALVGNVWFISMAAAAAHLGLARRALDEARNELRGKVDRYSRTPLLEHPSVHRALVAGEGLWFACRAGLREALRDIWHAALRGEAPTDEARLTARVAAVTAVQRCTEVVRSAYDTVGASAIRRSGVMERLMRDASCLTHHAIANQASYETTGRARVGVDRMTFRV
jgi:alkylation response protein AidB-like acyl-CoA dehydrogenase